MSKKIVATENGGPAMNMSLRDYIACAAMTTIVHTDVDNVLDSRGESVDALRLSVRARNCLQDADIHTIERLTSESPQSLLRLRSMGRTTVREIEDKLKERGLFLTGTTKKSVAYQTAAQIAYEYADAMLAARKAGGK